MNGITAHMILKNEDRWVWFALQSILPYADQILVTDTGSTDKTLDILKTISSPKIKLTKTNVSSSADVTRARSLQLEKTKTDWIWIVDGDEVYPTSTAKECLSAIGTDLYEGIAVRRYDLLGDIYHRQVETVGSYNLLGETGHLVTRFVNQAKIKGLHYAGDYPMEGWYDAQNLSTQNRDKKNWYIIDNYLYHAMYLQRSSLGGNLPIFNRGKYKIETGIKISSPIPEIFTLSHPPLVPDPLARRSTMYEFAAAVVTPIKNLKRKLL
jgi:glycosyltransferase involved in cell wall biosynthesis